MKKIVGIAFLLVLSIVMVACSSSTDGKEKEMEESKAVKNADNTVKDEEKVMKFGSINTSDRSITLAMNKFAEQVEADTNGSVKVEVFPDSQLGGERDNFEGLQLGSLQASIVSTAVSSIFLEDMSVLDLPFLFKDTETAYKVLDGEIGQGLLAELESEGVIGMNFWENGFRHVTNSVREVKTPEDLQGLKIRTMESQMHLDLWEELGAIPTTMAFPELFSALQQGTVDGQENPYVVTATNNFYEAQDYLTVTEHVYGANIFLISKVFWDTLSDEEKEIINEAAEDAKVYQREVEQEQAEEFLDLLVEKGMKVTELTEEERYEFIKKAQPIYEQYSKEIGEELVNKTIEAAK